MPQNDNTIRVCLFDGCGRPHYAHDLCIGHNMQRRKGRPIRPLMADVPVSERFWAKVNKNGPTMPGMDSACWVWTAGCNTCGYGQFRKDGRNVMAHRLAYETDVDSIPDGLCICHRCDNPSCVNPAHLFAGTKAENAHDRDRKGRQVSPRGDASGSRKHPERCPRGEAHGMAQIAEADVLAIRERYAAGGITKAALARSLGMSKVHIGDIIRRRSWRHV